MNPKNNQNLGSKAIMDAAFGAGCFWHVEEAFRTVPGVISTTVGYMGGHTADPTYEDVCSNSTGHIETVHVEYDPTMVTYAQLLEKFFSIHDPTSQDKQGNDIGIQYRSIIFYYDESQRIAAQEKIFALDNSSRYKKPIVTLVVKASEFYRAEEYHQRYLLKKDFGMCDVQAHAD